MEPEKGKQVDVLKAGKSAAVKIDAVTSIQYGRQFDHTYSLYARVTRRSIDAIKELFKEGGRAGVNGVSSHSLLWTGVLQGGPLQGRLGAAAPTQEAVRRHLSGAARALWHSAESHHRPEASRTPESVAGAENTL